MPWVHLRGKKQSPEHIAKRVAALAGKRHSPETRAKISAIQTGKKRGPMPPQTRAALMKSNLTRVVSAETREKMRQAQIARAARGEAPWQGRKRPGLSALMRTRTPPHRKRVPYGDFVFRSGWERRVAQALDTLGVKWQYEPTRFDLGDRCYTPDFFLPDDGCYWEVKGWYGPQSQMKVESFRRQFPDIPLVLFNKDCLLELERRAAIKGA